MPFMHRGTLSHLKTPEIWYFQCQNVFFNLFWKKITKNENQKENFLFRIRFRFWITEKLKNRQFFGRVTQKLAFLDSPRGFPQIEINFRTIRKNVTLTFVDVFFGVNPPKKSINQVGPFPGHRRIVQICFVDDIRTPIAHNVSPQISRHRIASPGRWTLK